MKKILLGAGALLIIILTGVFTDITQQKDISADITAHIESKKDLIIVSSPTPQKTITSPVAIQGKARGYWFFEASFPIILTDWDGKIIAEGYATAQSDWMTEDFVPFESTLEFTTPDTYNRGVLILQKANASGLPEHDDALEIPVAF